MEEYEEDQTEEEYLFTCKDCGSHDLEFEHIYEVIQGRCTITYSETGWEEIDSEWDHRFENLDRPEEVDRVYDEPDYDDPDDEEEEEADAEIDDDSHEFYVRCEGCRREIEFGWSHPDRGGRFWPSECSDFNPWRCWPEPRYREEWAKKGWLRPTSDRMRGKHAQH